MTNKSNHTEDFHDNELVLLHTISPLSQYRQFMIWMKIKKILNLGLYNKMRIAIRTTFAGLLVLILGLSTVTTNAKVVVLESEQTGWNAYIDTDSMELSITAINPVEIQKDEYCVMWFKTKDGKATIITKLPTTGTTYEPITQKVLELLKESTVIISIENSQNLKYPGRIEYMKEYDN